VLQLGDFISDLEAASVSGAEITTDPCFQQVIGLTQQFLASFPPAPPSTGPAVGPTFQPGGVGLCSAVTPIKLAIWVNQNRWSIPVGLAMFLGLFVGIGYKVGRRVERHKPSTTAATP